MRKSLLNFRKVKMKKLILITLLILLLFPVVYCENKEIDELPYLIPYRKGDKWGFCDKDKNIVIECKYSETYPVRGELLKVKKNGRYGCINRQGKVVIPFIYDFLYFCKDNYYKVNSGYKPGCGKPGSPGSPLGLWGLRDKDGNLIFEAVYKEIYISDKNEVFLKDESNKWHQGTLEGKIEKKVSQKYIYKKMYGVNFKYINDRNGLSNTNSLDNIDISKYHRIRMPKEERIPVKVLATGREDLCQTGDRYKFDSNWGFIDVKGKQVIPLKYSYVEDFSKGLSAVRIGRNRKEAKWGFIDRDGKVIIPILYDDAKSFSEGLACVRKDNKWGYIDKQGDVVIPLSDYFRCSSFKEGRARVEKWVDRDSRIGFIDKNGKVVILIKYQSAMDFNNGLAHVKYQGKWGYIDKNGTEYWED